MLKISHVLYLFFVLFVIFCLIALFFGVGGFVGKVKW